MVLIPKKCFSIIIMRDCINSMEKYGSTLARYSRQQLTIQLKGGERLHHLFSI